jgi:phosphoribosyl-ATP pyrophosphohydrolase
MKETRNTHRIPTRRSNGKYVGTTAQRGNGAGEAVLSRSVNSPFVNGIDIGAPRADAAGRTATVDAAAAVLEHLAGALSHVTAASHPRTFKLLQSGRRKLARKLIEEACEVTVEAVKRDVDGMVRESADLLYHLVVLWFHAGIDPTEIWNEMQARADALGIAEKLPKPAGQRIGRDKLNC